MKQSTLRHNVLSAMALLCVLAATTASANTTNDFVVDHPYTNDFEQYATNTYLVGQDGWYAVETDAVVVVNHELDGGQHPYIKDIGDPPLTNSTHTNAMQLNSDATNLVTGSAQTFYIDTLVMPRRWEEEEPPDVPTDMRTAVYFDTNGYLVGHAKYYVAASNSWHTNWLTFDTFTVPTNTWVRLTIGMEMQVVDNSDFFQVKLDGLALDHPWGAQGTTLGGRTNNPGSWFQCADNSKTIMSSLVFNGTGLFDDLVVSTNNPLPASKVPINVKWSPYGSGFSTPGGISDEGTLTFDQGSLVNLTFVNLPQNWHMTNMIYDGTNYVPPATPPIPPTVFWGPNGIDGTKYSTATFIWPSLMSGHSIEIQCEGMPRTYMIASSGLGTPTPAVGGPYPGFYYDYVTSSISYSAATNTTLERHTCDWIRGGVTNSAGSGSTNYEAVFRLDGIFGMPDSLTWDMYLEHKLNTSKQGAPGFTDADGTVTDGDWHRTNAVVLLTATGTNGWSNGGWLGDTNGCTPTNGQSGLLVPMTQPRTNIIANFFYSPSAGPYNLAVTNVGGYGSPVPAAGTQSLADGTVTNCIMTGSPVAMGATTQMFCTGWTGTGRIPSSGTDTNTGTFLLSTNSSVTWNWEQQHKLTTTNAGAGVGSISKTPDQDWFGTNATVDLEAIPGLGSIFDYWEASNTNGIDTNSATISVLMDEAKSMTAYFSVSGVVTGAMGTPSTWYLAHGIGDYPDIDTAELDDRDLDGKLNWEEYVTGTDPTNSASFFHVMSQTSTVSSNCVVFMGSDVNITNPPFSMYMSTNLLDSTWSLIESNSIPRSSTGTNTYWHASPGNPAFYAPTVIWTY